MILMLHELLQTFRYIGAKAAISFSRTNPWLTKHTLGAINFYGPKELIDDFDKALKTDLPKYDSALCKRIFDRKIALDVFCSDKYYYYAPDMGAFIIPRNIFDYGSEGVCQYIVYCITGIDHTGSGLKASIRILNRKKSVLECRKAMASWIREKNFPEQWLSSYTP